MNMIPPEADKPLIIYPDGDGLPMSDNTLQFQWIVTLQGGLDALFRDDPNVFVAGDLLWYPVEGRPDTRNAPDVLVAFGRPKGYRGSYQQWKEGGVAPQVVFEVLSPNNRPNELIRKFLFYDRYGVEEYYLYDPDHAHLSAWRRQGDSLEEIAETDGWVSPRLGVRFDLSSGDLQIFGPDGRRFLTYLELAGQHDQERAAREQAEQDRARAEQERERERQQKEHAEQEREHALRQAAEAAGRAERLAARLRDLGVDPDV
jgi:Uma2 family endonuclease